jgi:hypothetical protein
MARGTRSSRKQLVVPLVGVDVEEQRARGVGDVGDVGAVAGELPDEPGVDRAERELAARRALARAGNLVEQPRELGAAEIRVDHEPGALADQAFRADLAQVLAQPGGAPVLPHDRVRDRLAGLPVPDDGRFALVGDAYCQKIFCRNATLSERVARHIALRLEDLARVVLDPARLRKDLAELALARAPPGRRPRRRGSPASWWCPDRGPERTSPKKF